MKISNLIIALIFVSCGNPIKEQEVDLCGSNKFYQKIEKVSFDDVEHIKKVNGRFVEIEGFFYYNFEDVALYPTKSSNSTADALWLNLKLPDTLLDKLSKKKVRVIGRLNILQKGHLGGYLATLDSTFCMKEVVH
jgi:hypothetical protein